MLFQKYSSCLLYRPPLLYERQIIRGSLLVDWSDSVRRQSLILLCPYVIVTRPL